MVRCTSSPSWLCRSYAAASPERAGAPRRSADSPAPPRSATVAAALRRPASGSRPAPRGAPRPAPCGPPAPSRPPPPCPLRLSGHGPDHPGWPPDVAPPGDHATPDRPGDAPHGLHPACRGGGDRARQPGARLPVQEEQAPPAVALAGTSHPPAVETPGRVGRGRLAGRRRGHGGRGGDGRPPQRPSRRGPAPAPGPRAGCAPAPCHPLPR
jgi:hypothetical protein